MTNGIDFVNLVELTFSSSNEAMLLKKEFKPGKVYSSRNGNAVAVEGSLDLADELLEWATENAQYLPIHVCSVEKRMSQMKKRYGFSYEST